MGRLVLLRGYEVFRPINPICFCDLLIVDRDRPVRVEVKVVDESGPRPFVEVRRNTGNFDVLACVFKSGQIAYNGAAKLDPTGARGRVFIDPRPTSEDFFRPETEEVTDAA